jgi:hypothetical protein
MVMLLQVPLHGAACLPACLHHLKMHTPSQLCTFHHTPLHIVTLHALHCTQLGQRARRLHSLPSQPGLVPARRWSRSSLQWHSPLLHTTVMYNVPHTGSGITVRMMSAYQNGCHDLCPSVSLQDSLPVCVTARLAAARRRRMHPCAIVR